MILSLALCLSFCPPPTQTTEQRLRELEKKHPDTLLVLEIGKSRKGRPVLVACLGKGAASLGIKGLSKRPSAILVAGLDGRRVDDARVALAHIESIASAKHDSDWSKRLEKLTLFIVPEANPDGAQPRLREGNAGTLDDDRDGREGEDGPDDLDGDGKIRKMRVVDPRGKWVLDKEHPEGIRKAIESDEGQRYAVYPEGADDDKDGKHNEDAAGGVILNKNFPHLYREHEAGAGVYALSEPESLALAEFIISQPTLNFVLCYGSADNLLSDPKVEDGTERKEPQGFFKADAWMTKELGETYREITSREGANHDDWPGRFTGWAYCHAGLPLFATSLIDRAPKKEVRKEEDTDEDKSKDTDQGAAQKPSSPAKTRMKPKSSEIKAQAWALAAFGEQAMTAWKPFEHPTLGPIEIGGFDDNLVVRIPNSMIPDVIRTHEDFLALLCDSSPDLVIQKVTSKELAPGVHEVKVLVINAGRFAPRTEMARKLRRLRGPRITIENETGIDLVFGKRWRFVDAVHRRGTHQEFRWVLRTSNGTKLRLSLRREGMTLDRKAVQL